MNMKMTLAAVAAVALLLLAGCKQQAEGGPLEGSTYTARRWEARTAATWKTVRRW